MWHVIHYDLYKPSQTCKHKPWGKYWRKVKPKASRHLLCETLMTDALAPWWMVFPEHSQNSKNSIRVGTPSSFSSWHPVYRVLGLTECSWNAGRKTKKIQEKGRNEVANSQQRRADRGVRARAVAQKPLITSKSGALLLNQAFSLPLSTSKTCLTDCQGLAAALWTHGRKWVYRAGGTGTATVPWSQLCPKVQGTETLLCLWKCLGTRHVRTRLPKGFSQRLPVYSIKLRVRKLQEKR